MRSGVKGWLGWTSLGVFIVSLVTVTISPATDSFAVKPKPPIAEILIGISVLSLIALFVLNNPERKWLRFITGKAIYLSLFCIICILIFSDYLNSAPFSAFKDTIYYLLNILLVVAIFFSTIHIFLIRNMEELKTIIALLIGLVLSLIASHLFESTDIPFLAQMFILMMTATGVYMFGIRCLLLPVKNTYFRSVSFISSFLISLGSYSLAMIFSNENFQTLEIIYFPPSVFFTFFVLISIPMSGYINWAPLEKKILNKIMILWIFFFLIFSLRFVFPQLFKTLQPTVKETPYHFDMRDYVPENKNGLLQEQPKLP